MQLLYIFEVYCCISYIVLNCIKLYSKHRIANCQVQFEAELALFSFDPATPPHPPVKVYFPTFFN